MAVGREQLKTVALGIGLALFCLLAIVVIWSFDLNETLQLVLTAFVLFLIPVAVLIRYFRRRQPLDEPPASEDQASVRATPRSSYPELEARTAEAVKWMRGNLRSPQSDDAVYSLPWFLVAGPQGSGKTSLLVSSDLDFQALPGQLRAEENLIRPTLNCDWRITNSVVWLDTAGRYQSEGPGRDEWLGMIETIREVRPQRPLDGLLLVISLAGIVAGDEAKNREQAKILRDRLDELTAAVQLSFPVYLIFTYAEVIEGFEEFFRNVNPMELGQVWGATFPLDQARGAHRLFYNEFKALYESLMSRRLLCLSSAVRPTDQLRIFDFPLRFNLLGRKLEEFVHTLCAPNAQDESPMLRGFYFARSRSGASENRPAASVPAPRPGVTTAVQTTSAGVFSHDLFHSVLLQDRGIAAALQSQQQKPRRWRQAAVAAVGLLLLTLTVGILVSYFGNRSLIQRAVEQAREIADLARADGQAKQDPSAKPADAVEKELQKLGALREQLVELDRYDSGERPLWLRFGLYSGGEIKPYLRTIYFEQTYLRFLKPTAEALKQDLISFTPPAGEEQAGQAPSNAESAGENDGISERDRILGSYYDLLKAYLMMSNIKPKEAPVEDALLSQELASRSQSPLRLSEEQHAQMREHLRYYARQAGLDDAPHLHLTENDAEIGKARGHLSQAYQLVVYKSAISRIKLDTLKLEDILQGEGRDLLSGSYAVPGSYTIEGYQQFRDNLPKVTEVADQEKWVLGPALKSSGQVSSGELEGRYRSDYINHWRNFVRGIQLLKINNENASKVLEELSLSGSPLEKLLLRVAKETNVSATPTGRVVSWFKNLISSKTIFRVGNDRIEKEFRPLFDFVGDEYIGGKETPLLKYQAALYALSTKMAESQPAGDPRRDPRLANAEPSLAGPLGTFKSTAGFKTPAAQYIHDLLRQPLKRLIEAGSGQARENLIKEWNALAPQAREFETAFRSGFPFNSSAGPAVVRFNEFFNPSNGQLKSLFENQTILPDSLANYLDKAKKLRDALYPQNSDTPKVSIDVTINGWADPEKYVEIKIDNSVITSQNATGKCQWPSSSGEIGAQIKIVNVADQRPFGEPLKFSGEWGVFQMFARGNPRPGTNDSYDLSWSVAGYTVRANLKAPKNIFQRELYRDWQTPQNLSN